jgi:hypothetical protein
MKKGAAVFFCVFLCLVVVGTAFGKGKSLDLAPVSRDAYAAEGFLETEAGISAYGQIPLVVIDTIKPVFKNIEKETSQYIIGSVALAGYPESDDVHVYVDISGWIIAYYLNQELAAKIIDWAQYRAQGTLGTKLEDAVALAAAQMGYSLPPITYYDFRYPNANKIMIIIDEEPNTATQTFLLTLPSLDYFFYGREWSHAQYRHSGFNDDSNLKIDGQVLHSAGTTAAGWNIYQGIISPIQLSPDVTHQFALQNTDGGDLDVYAAVLLIYSAQGE